MRQLFGTKTVWLIVCCLCIGAGCTTMDTQQGGALSGSTITTQQPLVDDPLVTFCNRRGIAFSYDTFTGLITLYKGVNEMRLLIGSTLAYSNGHIIRISGPLQRDGGVVTVTESLKALITNELNKKQTNVSVDEKRHHRIKHIVLDAGHGGKDPGAIGQRGLREKDVALDITKRLKNVLEKGGFKVTLTRSTDTFITLEGRPEVANTRGADLFISIHANASRARKTRGFEVYYLSDECMDKATRALVAKENQPFGVRGQKNDDLSKNTKAILWDMIYTQNKAESLNLSRAVCDRVSEMLGFKVRGIKGAPFRVLRLSQMPAVLIEVAFISNKAEEQKLRSKYFRQQIAEALGSGIARYAVLLNGSSRYAGATR